MSEVQYKTCRGVISDKSLLRRAEGKEREREYYGIYTIQTQFESNTSECMSSLETQQKGGEMWVLINLSSNLVRLFHPRNGSMLDRGDVLLITITT